jgi:hypothetical protein
MFLQKGDLLGFDPFVHCVAVFPSFSNTDGGIDACFFEIICEDLR